MKRHTGPSDTNLEFGPLPVQVESWAKWFMQQSYVIREMVLRYDLAPWHCYSLAALPGHATYYRFGTVSACDKDNHLHISMMCFTFSGEQFGMVEDVEVENLRPYPYSPTNPPPPEELEREAELMEQIDMIAELIGEDTNVGAIQDFMGDPLTRDDRHGRDSGH